MDIFNYYSIRGQDIILGTVFNEIVNNDNLRRSHISELIKNISLNNTRQNNKLFLEQYDYINYIHKVFNEVIEDAGVFYIPIKYKDNVFKTRDYPTYTEDGDGIKGLNAIQLPSKLRSLIYTDYIDVDLRAAHYSILEDLFFKLLNSNTKPKNINNYLFDKETFIKNVMNELNFKTDISISEKKYYCKNLINSILFNGNIDTFNLTNKSIVETIEEPKFINSFKDEVRYITNQILDNVKIQEYLNPIINTLTNEEKKKLHNGSKLSYVCQYVERLILHETLYYIKNILHLEIKNCCLSYDGVLIHKSIFDKIDLLKLNKYLNDTFNFNNIEYVIKQPDITQDILDKSINGVWSKIDDKVLTEIFLFRFYDKLPFKINIFNNDVKNGIYKFDKATYQHTNITLDTLNGLLYNIITDIIQKLNYEHDHILKILNITIKDFDAKIIKKSIDDRTEQDNIKIKNYNNNKTLIKHVEANIKALQKYNNIKNYKLIPETLINNDYIKAVDNKDMATDKNIICHQNGYYNLLTGEFKFYTGAEFTTLKTNIIYDPNKTLEQLNNETEFIKNIINDILPDYDQREYFLTALSTSLYGEVSNYILMITGEGQNAKSFLLKLIIDIVGGYGDFKKSTFLTDQGKQGGADSDAAACKNKRVLYVDDLGDKIPLNNSMLKQLNTGKITGRDLYQKAKEISDIQHYISLFLSFNRSLKLDIDEYQRAETRRYKLIRFRTTFYNTEAELQKALKNIPATDKHRHKLKVNYEDLHITHGQAFIEYLRPYLFNYLKNNKSIPDNDIINNDTLKLLTGHDEIKKYFEDNFKLIDINELNNVYINTNGDNKLIKSCYKFSELKESFLKSNHYKTLGKNRQHKITPALIVKKLEEWITQDHNKQDYIKEHNDIIKSEWYKSINRDKNGKPAKRYTGSIIEGIIRVELTLNDTEDKGYDDDKDYLFLNDNDTHFNITNHNLDIGISNR